MLKAAVDKLETCSSAGESAERTTEPEPGETSQAGDVEPEETDDRPQKKARRSLGDMFYEILEETGPKMTIHSALQGHTPTPPSPSVPETGGLGLLLQLAEVSLGYCDITRSEFEADPNACRPPRTPETYDTAVADLQAENIQDVRGIKPYAKIQRMRGQQSGCSDDVKEMFLLLLSYFYEKEESMFFHVEDTCLAEEVQLEHVPLTPAVIVCEKGTKVENDNLKRRLSVNPRVLTLIQELSDHEWR
ncbi:unnamed protein product [Merluccius merluccius]